MSVWKMLSGAAILLASQSSPGAAQAPDAASVVPLDRAFLVGRGGRCDGSENSVTFHDDATYQVGDELHHIWLLRGDELLAVGALGGPKPRIRVLGPDEMEMTMRGGAKARLKRCPGNARGRNLPIDGSRLDAAFLTGRWFQHSWEDVDCKRAMTLKKNGEALGVSGKGRWSLAGDRLSITLGRPEPMVVQLVPLSRNRVLTVHEEGLSRLTRC